MSQYFIREVQRFLDKDIRPLLKERWSSEVTVPMETKFQSDSLEYFDVIIDTPRKNMKLFSQKQLQFIREVLLFDENRDERINSIIFNIEQEILFRSKGQIDQLFIEQLTRAEKYCFVLDKYWMKRRSFFGRLFGREELRDGNLYNFQEMVSLLLPRVLKIPRRRPKPTQRIRGYRDHGTLGSDNPNKEITDNLAIEKDLANKKKQCDTIEFLQGFIW